MNIYAAYLHILQFSNSVSFSKQGKCIFTFHEESYISSFHGQFSSLKEYMLLERRYMILTGATVHMCPTFMCKLKSKNALYIQRQITEAHNHAGISFFYIPCH